MIWCLRARGSQRSSNKNGNSRANTGSSHDMNAVRIVMFIGAIFVSALTFLNIMIALMFLLISLTFLLLATLLANS